MIGVKIQNTRHVNSQTGLAVNEKQQILLKSVKRPEKQVRHNCSKSELSLLQWHGAFNFWLLYFVPFQVINITSWDDGKLFEVQVVNIIMSCNQTKGKLAKNALDGRI